MTSSEYTALEVIRFTRILLSVEVQAVRPEPILQIEVGIELMRIICSIRSVRCIFERLDLNDRHLFLLRGNLLVVLMHDGIIFLEFVLWSTNRKIGCFTFLHFLFITKH